MILELWGIKMHLYIKNYVYLIISVFLLSGCIKTIEYKNKNKILYFIFMAELEYNGKIYFRTKIDKNQLNYYEKLKGYPSYYKVYHQGIPKKVEEYNLKNNHLKKIYFFNKYAIVKKTIDYTSKNEEIICNYLYEKNKKIKICNNQIKTITLIKNHSWNGELQYKNNEIYRKKVLKNNKVYILNSEGKVLEVFNYYEPDNIPIEFPKNDRYPWKI
jgi:hypothetical protein